MIPLVSIGLLVTGLLFLTLLLWHFPAHTGLVVLAVVAFLDCLQIWFGDGFNLGVTVFLDDVACVALIAGATIIATRHGRRPRDLCMPPLLLLGLVALNFLRGVVLNGVNHAGNGSRDLVYVIVPFLAFDAMRPVFKVSFSRATVWLYGTALLLTVIALCRWAGLLPMWFLVGGTEYDAVYDFREIPRALPPDYVMIIAQALIAAVGVQLRRVRLTGMLMAGLFGVIILFMQHRSVWSATVVGLTWLLFRSMRLTSPRQWMQFSLAAMTLVTIVSVYAVASGRIEQVNSMLKENIDEAKSSDSTFAWRLDGFAEAIDRTFSGDLVELLIGPPAGQDLSNTASFASVHIHNRYIDALAFYGVSGLLLLLTWLWMLASRVRRLPPPATGQVVGGLAGPIWEAILLSELTFFLAYFGGIVHGALLGLLWAVCAGASETQPIAVSSRRAAPEIPNPALA